MSEANVEAIVTDRCSCNVGRCCDTFVFDISDETGSNKSFIILNLIN